MFLWKINSVCMYIFFNYFIPPTCPLQTHSIEQFFFSVLLHIMLHKVALTIESVDEILKSVHEHSHEDIEQRI